MYEVRGSKYEVGILQTYNFQLKRSAHLVPRTS